LTAKPLTINHLLGIARKRSKFTRGGHFFYNSFAALTKALLTVFGVNLLIEILDSAQLVVARLNISRLNAYIGY